MATKEQTSQADIATLKIGADGSFKRSTSTFRDTIEAGGRFKPERGEVNAIFIAMRILTNINPDRYRLYVSYACRMSDLQVLDTHLS